MGLIFGGGRSRGGRRGRSSRRRGGFYGPFPYYSGQTRRGSRVTVTGCCLPLPLTLVIGAAMGTRALLRR